VYAVLFTLTTATLGALVVRATGERLLAERGNVGTARARPNFLLGSIRLAWTRSGESSNSQLPAPQLPSTNGQRPAAPPQTRAVADGFPRKACWSMEALDWLWHELSQLRPTLRSLGQTVVLEA
jgi:hypothetical protein